MRGDTRTEPSTLPCVCTRILESGLTDGVLVVLLHGLPDDPRADDTEVPPLVQGGATVFDRITFDPRIMGGRACIRGMRIGSVAFFI
jgi:Protein of unknown function (DUF433)